MYRVELSPGEETAFRSIEELAVAIRRKVVTSRARIYHNATSKWLPIQFHPHYKIACSMPLTQADLVAGPTAKSRSTLKLDDGQAQSAPPLPAPSNREAATQAALSAWPEPKPIWPPVKPPAAREIPRPAAPSVAPIQLGTPAPEPRSALEVRRVEPRRVVDPRPAAEPRRIVEPVRADPPQRAPEPRFIEPRANDSTTTKRSRRRNARRTLRLALAAAVFIACAHLAVSGASSVGSATASRTRTPRQLIEAPAEALKELTPRTVAAVMPVLQSIPLPAIQPATTEPPTAIKKAAVTTTGFPKRPPVVSPAPAAAVIDSAPSPDIAAAPDAGPIVASELPNAESLAPRVVDSTGKTTFKRMLRTISGTPATKRKPAKP